MYKRQGYEGAEILGIHFEGPYLDMEYKGAQPPEAIAKPTVEQFKDVYKRQGWITEDARFNEFVRANYRNEYELARAMRDYIESVVSCKMTEEEVIYLAVQLKYADIKKKEGKKNGIF